MTDDPDYVPSLFAARRRLGLSPRELDVLLLLAEGETNARIAVKLHLSTETVKQHVKNILFKLEAKTRTHAVTICFREGALA